MKELALTLEVSSGGAYLLGEERGGGGEGSGWKEFGIDVEVVADLGGTYDLWFVGIGVCR